MNPVSALRGGPRLLPGRAVLLRQRRVDLRQEGSPDLLLPYLPSPHVEISLVTGVTVRQGQLMGAPVSHASSTSARAWVSRPLVRENIRPADVASPRVPVTGGCTSGVTTTSVAFRATSAGGVRSPHASMST